MADWFYKYFKTAADNNIISKNKWLILLIISAVTGGTGTGIQSFRIGTVKAEAEKQTMKAVTETASAFQAVLAKKQETKPTPKQVTITRIVTKNCKSECQAAVKQHEREWHGAK
jgi:hypothetical protein